MEQASLWSVPGGEGLSGTLCYLLLCPDPGRMPLQIPGPRLWKRRAAPSGWRWLPGSTSPGNMDWKHRCTPGRGGTGVRGIRLSGQTQNVHVAQTESHNHPGPSILSRATLLLALGLCSVPSWVEECVLILALNVDILSLVVQKADLVHFCGYNNQDVEWEKNLPQTDLKEVEGECQLPRNNSFKLTKLNAKF